MDENKSEFDPEIKMNNEWLEDRNAEQDFPPDAPRSLQELIERVSGKDFQAKFTAEDAGLAEALPFPFLALVGQQEMKLALILALINPSIGGALLVGPRGTGKTTSVRSLVNLLPDVPRSLCHYGCMPEDIESGGIEAVCPTCAQKYINGEPLTKIERARMVELPLNAKMEDVIGGLDERVAVHDRVRIRRGLLAQSDRNILYIDEVNLLKDEIIDAILDAAAQGQYTVRRGPISATYRSRFVLIGSMNPEEGRLRPQIMDRFGLRVMVRGLDDTDERLEAYRRVQAYLTNPRKTVAEYEKETDNLKEEIQSARKLLGEVEIPDQIAQLGLEIIRDLDIDSLRAEISMFEAARAYAAADNRKEVKRDDLEQVALMALRARRSKFMREFLKVQDEEDHEIRIRFTKNVEEKKQ